MSYVDAHYDSRAGQVLVWERGDSGVELRRFSAPFYFYYTDVNGDRKSIFGDSVSRADFRDKKSFESAVSQAKAMSGVTLFESDISPLDKVLMENYYNVTAPKITYGLFDIEVDYDKTIGYAKPENPYAPINAITIWVSSEDRYHTIAIPPKPWLEKGWVGDVGLAQLPPDLMDQTNITLVATERELLLLTLDIIERCDLISGWFSDGFDVPYCLKRSELILSKRDHHRWSRAEAPPPSFRTTTDDYGKDMIKGVLYGRVHLDYRDLFKKFTFEGRESYSLAAISATEAPHVQKLDYDGSLEGLYVNDFPWFLRYNKRDVEALRGIDQKHKLIDLANELGHKNTVVLGKVLGSVHPIDCGIINFVHHELNLVVNDKQGKKGSGIKGAMVLVPKVGMHPRIGSIDINSLYPSVYRTLNISPEMLVGQFNEYEAAWDAIYQNKDVQLTLVIDGTFTGGEQTVVTQSAIQWKEFMVSAQWAVSAYGTVFDQSRGQGFIPQLLARWYSERKSLRKQGEVYADEVDRLIAAHGVEIDDAIQALIDSGEYRKYKKKDKYIGVTAEIYDLIVENQAQADFYDRKQHVVKILLKELRLTAGMRYETPCENGGHPKRTAVVLHLGQYRAMPNVGISVGCNDYRKAA